MTVAFVPGKFALGVPVTMQLSGSAYIVEMQNRAPNSKPKDFFVML